MTHTDLLRQALDALIYHRDQTRPIDRTDAVIDALRAALAAPVEPVAQPAICSNCGGTGIDGDCGPDGRSIDVNCASCYGTGIGRGFSGIATPPAQPAPAVQVVLRQPNLFAADPAAPAVNCEWTNCPRRVGDVCCNDRPAAPAVPAVDCRTCARCYATKGRGVFGCDSVVTCANGDRYQPLPPVQLWRTP